VESVKIGLRVGELKVETYDLEPDLIAQLKLAFVQFELYLHSVLTGGFLIEKF
jgi:hypothetical protein